MARERYHAELKLVEDRTLDLGRMVASAVVEAADAFTRHDEALAEQIIARDKRVNRERLELEKAGLTMIATQQPVAVDMRTLAALQEVVGEIERMGDYAKGIASITLRFPGEPLSPALQKMLIDMAERSRDMLRSSLDAFEQRDADLARRILPEDDAVDDLFSQVYENVMSLDSPDVMALERANYVLWVAHNLERTADRVMNVCERVIYVATGELVSGRKMAAKTK